MFERFLIASLPAIAASVVMTSSVHAVDMTMETFNFVVLSPESYRGASLSDRSNFTARGECTYVALNFDCGSLENTSFNTGDVFRVFGPEPVSEFFASRTLVDIATDNTVLLEGRTNLASLTSSFLVLDTTNPPAPQATSDEVADETSELPEPATVAELPAEIPEQPVLEQLPVQQLPVQQLVVTPLPAAGFLFISALAGFSIFRRKRTSI